MPDYTPGTKPSDIWTYATRELTQSKFSFWSSIIEQTASSITVGATSSVTVDIQPSAGEQWWIWIGAFVQVTDSGSYITYEDYDGTTANIHNECCIAGSYGLRYPHLGVQKVISNTLYARILFYNSGGSDHTGHYGYSGFKLSRPIARIKRTIPSLGYKPYRATKFMIDAKYINMKDKIIDVYDANERKYKQAIFLEKDKVLAIDENSNFPVERLTSHITVENLENLIEKIKTGEVKLVNTGLKKYIDEWGSKYGVDLGI